MFENVPRRSRTRSTILAKRRDMQKQRKISFFGNFGKRNFGNEGTLLAILENLRKALPDVEMNCICTGPADVAAAYNMVAVPIHGEFVKQQLLQSNALTRLARKIFVGIPIELYRWLLAIHFLGETSVLIVPGTQFLSDNLTGPWGWPYMTFRWSIAAKLRRCKLLFVSVGVGPLRHPLSRFFVKAALRLADFRSYRDQSSKEYVIGIGVKAASDPVYPDLAFSLDLPAAPRTGDGDRPRPVVAVGVQDYHGQFGPWPRAASADETYRCYLSRMTAFVAWLLEHDYTVRLVIGDMSYDTPVLADLQRALSERGTRYERHCLIVEPMASVDELVSQLVASDFIVSPRFHNILFGMLLGKPVLALSYHEKFTAVLDSCGLAGFSIPIDDADANSIIEKFGELECNRDEFQQRFRNNVTQYREALNQQYRQILQVVAASKTREAVQSDTRQVKRAESRG